MQETDTRVALVTGGNGGIGLETARGLARAGFAVVIHGRNEAKTREAASVVAKDTNATVDTLTADLADFAQVRAMAAAFRQRFGRLDVLVNNAGLFNRTYHETADGIEHTFAVNHLGHFVLTHELLDLMTPRKGTEPGVGTGVGTGRIVNVSSRAHERSPRVDFEDLNLRNRYGLWRAYGQSKLFNIWFTRELSRRLAGTGLTTHAVHPGVIATDIVRDTPGVVRWIWGKLAKSVEEGARTSLEVALGERAGRESGGYWRDEKPATPSKQARDDEGAARLWAESEKLTGATGWDGKIASLRMVVDGGVV
ncbi:MAG: SDR family oxidoreductase [Phycisphaerae bacterium]